MKASLMGFIYIIVMLINVLLPDSLYGLFSLILGSIIIVMIARIQYEKEN